MLKKRKHKIKRRNTEPSVNHPLVLATPSAGPVQQQGGEKQKGKKEAEAGSAGAVSNSGQQSPPFNLADICDSPTHATAV